MQNEDEELIAKLWLENNKNNQFDTGILPAIKKYSLNKKMVSTIPTFLKKNRINWPTLIHTAWALLLNRLSTADFTIYGAGEFKNNKKSEINFIAIKSTIDNKLSIKNLYKNIAMQLKNKNAAQMENIKYLLLFNINNKINNKTLLDFYKKKIFSLILIPNKKDFSEIRIWFDPVIFSQENINRFKNYLFLTLSDIIKDFDQKVISLNLLSKKELTTLEKWASPTYTFNIPKLTNTIYELFNQQALKNPEQLAILHHDNHITYGELQKAALNFAHLLKKEGIKPNDAVCVIMERTPHLIMALLSIFYCGAIYVPINPIYPEERIEYILNDCQTNFILADHLSQVPKKYHYKTKLIKDCADYINNHTVINYKKEIFHSKDPLEDIAYILYTSGTTGNPKGVIIKHAGLTNLIAWYQGCFKLSSKDRVSQFASQGFDTFLCEVIPTLASGASIHIIDDSIKLTPTLLFDWLIKNEITIADFPTAFAKVIFALQWPHDVKLKIVKIGGESIKGYPPHRLPFDIWNTYGPTETTIEATYIKIHSSNPTPGEKKHFPPPIGKPIINSKVYIVDKYLQLLPVGIAGELIIGGIGVAKGYLHLPDLTKEKFIHSPFHPHKNDYFYRTGDLVRWLDDGNIEFIGRVDNQVKIRGYRIEMGEIENVLTRYSDVSEVSIVIKSNKNNEKSLVAYIVPNLDKERFPYQVQCLIEIDNKYIEASTEDISKEGACVFGLTEEVHPGQLIKIILKFPGSNDEKKLLSRVVWKKDNKCGLYFEADAEEKNYISKSIDYYLSTQNVTDLLSTISNKRNLRKALQSKLPEYMIPHKVFTLLKFPLTFSGKIDTKSLPGLNEPQLTANNYIPPQSAIEKKLSKIWCDLLDKDRVSMSDNFFESGGNSILAAELTVLIFKEFNISIPVKVLFDLSFIPILSEYIETSGKQYTSQSTIQHQISADIKLEESLHPTGKLSKNLHTPQNIFLTGASGFLGIYLLRELLKNTHAKIYCLVRRGEFETPAQRFIKTVKYFQLDNEITLNNRRIIIVAGDASKEQFGLPQEQYNNLVKKIDLIFHCGAQVNIMSSYEKLRGSNVQGTLEVIKFATHAVDKPIHYISTLSSANKQNEAGELVEEFPDHNYDNLFGGYAISKWVSENLLSDINRRRLPVVIYRLGYISGQSDTGITNLNDALLMLIKGCIQLGYAPIMKEKITILPVDFVSFAVTHISLSQPAISGVYHIDHPTGIMWSDLVAWLNNYGYRIKLISIKEWKNKLVNIKKDNALYPFLPFYLSMEEDHSSPNVNTELASRLLQEYSIDYPKIDDYLLKTYINYLCKIHFLPIPEEQFGSPRIPIE